MARVRSTSRRRSTKARAASPRARRAASVHCWEDDPGDPRSRPMLEPIVVPAPRATAAPYPFAITGTAPAAASYPAGTPQFRYYATACALRRTADFWGGIVPRGTAWEVGTRLPVRLDDGVDLNAFYTRGDDGEAPGLHFFHEAVGGRVFFSGESPDVTSHEMGHAVLDSIRPQLFNAQSIEAAAFHESFGDMSAMLSALQVPSFAAAVLEETRGTLNRASRLSRLAEQLGAAIRVDHPDAVDADCLRSAANSFFYRDPQTLPSLAPSSQLSSEPHSFSRVFTGAFLDLLAGILSAQGASPSPAALAQTTQDAARLLVGGVLEAPVVPDYYSQVAAHMVHVGEAAPLNGKYRDVLKSAFVRRGILSLAASATVNGASKPVRLRKAAVERPSDLPLAAITAEHYGLRQATLCVHLAGESRTLAVTGSAAAGANPTSSAHRAAEIYTADLFQRGRVDVGRFGHPHRVTRHSSAMKTHRLVLVGGALVLKRRAFDCGLG